MEVDKFNPNKYIILSELPLINNENARTRNIVPKAGKKLSIPKSLLYVNRNNFTVRMIKTIPKEIS
jgi:hypothetical protein